MPTSISFRCPSCQVRIKAPIQLLGRWRPCPSCNHRFIVRAQPPQDAGPVLVPQQQTDLPQLPAD